MIFFPHKSHGICQVVLAAIPACHESSRSARAHWARSGTAKGSKLWDGEMQISFFPSAFWFPHLSSKRAEKHPLFLKYPLPWFEITSLVSTAVYQNQLISHRAGRTFSEATSLTTEIGLVRTQSPVDQCVPKIMLTCMILSMRSSLMTHKFAGGLVWKPQSSWILVRLTWLITKFVLMQFP